MVRVEVSFSRHSFKKLGDMRLSKKTADIFAAIHLGSEKVSLKVVEYRSLEDSKVLESAEQRVWIGEETFKTGKVSLATITEICDILNKYRRIMKEYRVEKYFLIGTTAMREARNRLFLIDQIFVNTGFKLEVVDMPLEIYYKYISISRTLKRNDIDLGGSAILFADISSGGLGITLVEDGEIKYQQNIHIGVIRVKESFDHNQRASNSFNTALTEYLSSIVSPVKDYLQQFGIRRMVLSGTNTSLILDMLDIKPGKNKLITLPTDNFERLYRRVLDMKLAKIMQEFGLSEQVAEIVLPTIIFYQQLIALTAAPELIFPPDSFIDAMVFLYIAREKEPDLLEELNEGLLSFVYNLAKRYNYNSGHARQVAKLSKVIFERLKKRHQLTPRHGLLLQVASIMHDIGKFINLRQHYFYSYRLILSTDIFGLSEEEKSFAAQIAYYHVKDMFEKTPDGISPLKPEDQPLIAKLAAILRLADALDRGYLQKITDCEILLKNNELQIHIKTRHDMSLERWTIDDKIPAFEDAFGIKPVLLEKYQ